MLALFVALLGLFPALFLTVLQAMLLLMLVWLLLHIRQLSLASSKAQLSWTHVALWQFFALFLINSIVFAPLPGTPDHFRAVAIETWSLSLLASGVLMLFLTLQEPERLKAALLTWLPVGLCLTFVVATYEYYINTSPEPRVSLATPNPLVPPLWFLILTMVSFSWLGGMNRFQKVFRGALFIMAGLMTLYTGARLVMFAWLVCGVLIVAYLIFLTPRNKRGHALLAGIGLVSAAVSLLFLIDYVGGGFASRRFEEVWDLSLSYAELRDRFPRLVLWDAAGVIIVENMPWGVGNINERILLQNEIGWEHWLRAHQSYLSYLIAGGPLALLSGLVFQLPVLQFLRREAVRDMFPAFVGLGVVLTLNCLTDSILQSGVAAQVYMVILLLICRAQQSED